MKKKKQMQKNEKTGKEWRKEKKAGERGREKQTYDGKGRKKKERVEFGDFSSLPEGKKLKSKTHRKKQRMHV